MRKQVGVKDAQDLAPGSQVIFSLPNYPRSDPHADILFVLSIQSIAFIDTGAKEKVYLSN